MKKNGFLTFCCACIPGCGEMYYGYMKRGFSLLFWTMAILAVSTIINIGSLMLFALVVWAYSFFDTWNIRNLSYEQRALFRDDYIPNKKWIDSNVLNSKIYKNKKIISAAGWILLIVGVFSIINSFILPILYRLTQHFYASPYGFIARGFYYIFQYIPPLLIAIIIIIVGVRVLKYSKQSTITPDDFDDYTVPKLEDESDINN